MYKCRGSMKELEMSAHVVVVGVTYMYILLVGNTVKLRFFGASACCKIGRRY
jgi:hypothetical protein